MIMSRYCEHDQHMTEATHSLRSSSILHLIVIEMTCKPFKILANLEIQPHADSSS